ncbi:MAG: hypothetical protein C6W58_06435 [Bacillaceae bacterium]|uniref:Uncharacterized protein n=2 Tax=Aeribacillus TaxID=1055323 RepID=A0A161ZPB8_9BACI|nr:MULTISPECIES: DUF5325 family protein [Aeribacillus]AXI39587.1 hypothetical protein CX649_08060 [Bacillaceae bacterium ZC4]REJ18862.1 MAG: hypothetical protein C6W58_06435 [Bacillaceae bacterium]KZM54391.1 hypothetical protein A3Q35_01910 [Aeribacillus pallidus]KZN94627.1 hypothetical protein AZI98_18155 [Aeribacillus pallidus]MDR9793585.1 DUF5325 family protein [Aeribacillus pallidus]
MGNGKWIFWVLATIAALLIVSVGFAIGAGSLLGVVVSIIGIIIVFGLGFTQKKKMRERGLL